MCMRLGVGVSRPCAGTAHRSPPGRGSCVGEVAARAAGGALGAQGAPEAEPREAAAPGPGGAGGAEARRPERGRAVAGVQVGGGATAPRAGEGEGAGRESPGADRGPFSGAGPALSLGRGSPRARACAARRQALGLRACARVHFRLCGRAGGAPGRRVLRHRPRAWPRAGGRARRAPTRGSGPRPSTSCPAVTVTCLPPAGRREGG